MRFAIVSDLHANLQAWDAVLVDARCSGIDRFICLGDVVGYGPNPAEVLKSVHAHVDHIALGNHDAVVAGKLDAALFNETARQIIEWTRGRLNQAAARFLDGLPLSLASDAFRCAHGEFGRPGAFDYVLEPEDAVPSWEARDEQLLFVGHTHRPALFLLGSSGVPRMVAPQDFEVEAGKRYLVNVGAVGQPRDGEPRAAYCIFDTASRSVFWRRVPFDMDAYRRAVEAAGIPILGSRFLRHDPRASVPPVRAQLDFSPPAAPEQAVRDAVAVQELDLLQKRVARWKGLAAMIALLAVVAGTLGGWLWWRHANRAGILQGTGFQPVSAASVSAQGITSRDRRAIPQQRNLLAAPPASAPVGTPLAGWRVELGDRRRQRVWVEPDATGRPVIVLVSETDGAELALVSRPVLAVPDQRFRLYAAFHKAPDFEGHVAAYAHLSSAGQPADCEWFHNPPDAAARDGWLLARKTFPPKGEALPASPHIQIAVRGRFTGTVRVRDLGLGRCE